MDSTNKKMLEILVGMVRLELKSPGKINDNDLDVQVDDEFTKYGELGNVFKSCIKTKGSGSKSVLATNLSGISTVVLSDDDQNDNHGHIQFGTVNYNELNPNKRTLTSNDKGKAPMVFECQGNIGQNSTANMVGSNYQRTTGKVNNLLKFE